MSTLKVNTITDSTGLLAPVFPAGSAQLNPIASREDKIINGDFDIWQRGTSGTASGYVAADRWSNILVGGTVTQSRQAFALGDTLGSNQPTAFLRQTVSGQSLASHYAATYQPIEGVRSYAGQTITVLGWARRSSGAGNMAVEAQQTFGTGGSPSTSVTGISPTSVTLGASWTPFAAVMNIPSIAGKTLGTNSDNTLGLLFWTSAGSDFNSRTNSLGVQTIGVDLWGIHIRQGTWTAAATADYRPRDPGTELALCQRYCSFVAVHAQGPVGFMVVPWYTPVTMRTTPIVTVTVAGTSTSAIPQSDAPRYPGGGYFQTQITAANGSTVDRYYRCDAEL